MDRYETRALELEMDREERLLQHLSEGHEPRTFWTDKENAVTRAILWYRRESSTY